MASRSTPSKTLRCAIYTRKSSEEGLEQDFNSLHAQRESCESYIKSQKHEGWNLLPRLYDDGGYSGGSMDRPALRTLLADIESRRIDVVVVYKVDRLTRSLTDFAKIVEVFDAAGVSFVSVTQQFNTTSSMGRLTLNVLLSFAQFEREVTGERIRDKIAASKQKGMWMGGWVPIGYDRKDRSLVVNETETKTVRTIFELYLKLGSVSRVQAELSRLNLKTKPYPTPRGRATGGLSFARGHIYKILSNPLYIGEIEHKGQRYPGQHPGIIDRATWDSVQSAIQRSLKANHTREYAKRASLLAGLLFDQSGRRMISAHAVKNGKRYRYYISTEDGYRTTNGKASKQRLPASEIDSLVLSRLAEYLKDTAGLTKLLGRYRLGPTIIKQATDSADKLGSSILEDEPLARSLLTEIIHKIDVRQDALQIALNTKGLLPKLVESAGSPRNSREIQETISVRASLQDIGVRNRSRNLTIGAAVKGTGNTALIKAIARGYCWFEELVSGKTKSIVEIAERENMTDRYVSRIIEKAMVTPSTVEQMLLGYNI